MYDAKIEGHCHFFISLLSNTHYAPQLHEPLLGGVQVDDLVHPGVVEVVHPLGAVLAVVLNLAQIFT